METVIIIATPLLLIFFIITALSITHKANAAFAFVSGVFAADKSAYITIHKGRKSCFLTFNNEKETRTILKS
tara:strand:- start:12667 stop:12882 length:216 start_codon:yes stop_codon:yes gene_type:complete